MAEKHLTVKELAEREDVAVETVYGWNKTGTGPRPMKIGGRLVRHRLEDVIRWEKSQLAEPRRGVARAS
jgi:predicted DNA-binding transcriptional regulator AlpA